ncbi:hypothetical protein GGI35DRAFT_436031 [Trichoderma velutinum]
MAILFLTRAYTAHLHAASCGRSHGPGQRSRASATSSCECTGRSARTIQPDTRAVQSRSSFGDGRLSIPYLPSTLNNHHCGFAAALRSFLSLFRFPAIFSNPLIPHLLAARQLPLSTPLLCPMIMMLSRSLTPGNLIRSNATHTSTLTYTSSLLAASYYGAYNM